MANEMDKLQAELDALVKSTKVGVSEDVEQAIKPKAKAKKPRTWLSADKDSAVGRVIGQDGGSYHIMPSASQIYHPKFRMAEFLVTRFRHCGGQGPTSSGKTYMFMQIGCQRGFDVYLFQCHERVVAEELRGSRGLEFKADGSGGTRFDYGIATMSLLAAAGRDKICADPGARKMAKVAGQSLNAAAAGRKVMLLVDEITLVQPGVQALLNGLLDATGYLTIPETGERVLRPKTWVFCCTCNPGYLGNRELQEALKDRLVMFDMQVDEKTEAQIIIETSQKWDLDPVTDMGLNCLQLIAAETRKLRKENSLPYDLGTRTLLQIEEIAQFMALVDNKGKMTSNVYYRAMQEVLMPKVGDPNVWESEIEGLDRAIQVGLSGISG